MCALRPRGPINTAFRENLIDFPENDQGPSAIEFGRHECSSVIARLASRGNAQSFRQYRKNFSVTKLIDKIASKLGRRLHEAPIAFKYICELMLEQNILIGGEESGGFGTSLYLPERDTTVSALFLAELMAWHGESLGELLAALRSEFGEYHYGPGAKTKDYRAFFGSCFHASSGMARSSP